MAAQRGRPPKTVINPFVEKYHKGPKLAVIEKINTTVFNGLGNKIHSDNYYVDRDAQQYHISNEIFNYFLTQKTQPVDLIVFFHIIKNLSKHREQLTLKPSEMGVEYGYSPRTIRESIGRMVKIDILSKMKGRNDEVYYWVNPLVVYNGNRVNYFIENVKEVKIDDIFYVIRNK